MINEANAKKYCCEDISLIENYYKAINDKTHMWNIHHKRGLEYSKDELTARNEYEGRPAAELIFLTAREHRRLHFACKKRKLSKEARQKMSDAHKGNKYNLNRHLTDEIKEKIRVANIGKKLSVETRKKLSENAKGRHHYNNGKISIMAYECPDGFVPGRLNK